MYFKWGISKNMIAKSKGVSKDFVIRWTRAPGEDFSEDKRGWKRGRGRRWDKETVKRIKRIHKDMKEDPRQFYIGATAVAQEWLARYRHQECPPLRTIGKILSDLHLSGKMRKDRHKGAARYLCYPEYTIYNRIGKRVLEADFIGKKFIKGRTEPVNFIGFSFKKEPRIRYYKRVEGQTAKCVIEECKRFFERFEKPDCIKVDNCLATIGSASGKRNLSKVMRFLLEQRVIPIFAVPRKPFSQASIEGNNSVFSKKFWKRYEFKDLEDIDEKLKWFNDASQRYSGYRSLRVGGKRKKHFRPNVYFIRQVKGYKGQDRRGSIDVLNECILLPPAYINYFVLAKWDLTRQELFVYLEKDKRLEIIKKLPFVVNKGTKNYEK